MREQGGAGARGGRRCGCRRREPGHANGHGTRVVGRARSAPGRGAHRGLRRASAFPGALACRGGDFVSAPAPGRRAAHPRDPGAHVPRAGLAPGHVDGVGARDPGPVLRGLAVPPARGARGPPRQLHDGHPRGARVTGGVRIQRVGRARHGGRPDGRGRRALLRHRRRHHHPGPGGQDARGAGTPVGRRCLPGADRAWRQGSHRARARRTRADGSIDELLVGMRVVVRPGEKIPADGVVKEGLVLGRPVLC